MEDLGGSLHGSSLSGLKISKQFRRSSPDVTQKACHPLQKRPFSQSERPIHPSSRYREATPCQPFGDSVAAAVHLSQLDGFGLADGRGRLWQPGMFFFCAGPGRWRPWAMQAAAAR